MNNQVVFVENLDLVRYSEAWEYQSTLLKSVVEKKRSDFYSKFPDHTRLHFLLLCDHPHVFTLGRSGSSDHLLANQEKLDQIQAEFIKINRGGDITYHGPGQLVAYPILDLDGFFTDVHKYVRSLEECIILLLAEYNIRGVRNDGYTGVWLENKDGIRKRKICAIGVHLSRWVSMHGLALNVNSDLSYFSNIIPCGIQEESRSVTSIQKELGMIINEDLLKERFIRIFQSVFQCKTIRV